MAVDECRLKDLAAILSPSQIFLLRKCLPPIFPVDVIAKLPTELVVHVFSYLSLKDMGRCMRVSQMWNQLTSEEAIWTQKAKEYDLNLTISPYAALRRWYSLSVDSSLKEDD
jgi:hypothetical protein